MNKQKKAVVLISGGLDSATTLAIARQHDYACYGMSFRYGQRHVAELDAANRVIQSQPVVEHKVIDIDLGDIGGSALTDLHIAVPEQSQEGIPVTYVPARNTIFLSMALAWAEVLQARDIFIGVNAVDYSGYPDCRPEYIHAYEQMANLATRDAVEGHTLTIHTPLIKMSKAEIIHTGMQLGVDYSQTVSCYAANEQGAACGHCDSCRLRREGFTAAGVPDPTIYA